jgi:hypothetical protein
MVLIEVSVMTHILVDADKISAFCRTYHMRHFTLSGSSLHGHSTADSDLDREPLPSKDLSILRFLVLNTTSELAHVGDLPRVEDGSYTAALSASST